MIDSVGRFSVGRFPVWSMRLALVLALVSPLAGCGPVAGGPVVDSPVVDSPVAGGAGGARPPVSPALACAPSEDIAGSAVATPTDGPEVGTGYHAKRLVLARSIMAVTAHPTATRIACEVLASGGTAVDAAVAAQMVLNLVEPQSSGIGGGAFMLQYEAASGAVRAYDGRETAPAAATGNDLRWVSDTDRTAPRPTARASGRSIGTPGVLRLLEMAHRAHGRLPWAELFQPAIALARDGFVVGPRMAASIAASAEALARDPQAAAYFLAPDGSPRVAGTLLRNPALADTLAAIASQGAAAFYTGPIAQDIVAEVADTAGGITPGRMTLADLAAYRAVERAPICTTYRVHTVCGMPPPSSGGIAVAATLGILENFDMARLAPAAVDPNGGRPAVQGVHLVAEANRLAYADRDAYVADPDFVPLPGGSAAALLDKAYLARRAALIRPDRTLGVAQPGDLGQAPKAAAATPEHGTSQITLADAYGNVVSMTTSIEAAFGSAHMTRGFLLNNQLTDFSAAPDDAAGAPIANRMQPGKRPRSSMAPTLVFRTATDGSRGAFVLATGSPGGAAIIQHVGKTLVGMLDWGLDAQQAVSLVDFGAANGSTTHVGGEHPAVDAAAGGAGDALVQGLRALGHVVSVTPRASGLSSIARVTVDGRPALAGGADPRRENAAQGDAIAP